jgi:Domain of unknown function (DUF1793)
LFAAAMATNGSLRLELISRVSNWTSSTNITEVFPVYYGSVDGLTLQGAARCVNQEIGSRVPIEVAIMSISPAQGAVFAPLALKFVQAGCPFFSFLTGVVS